MDPELAPLRSRRKARRLIVAGIGFALVLVVVVVLVFRYERGNTLDAWCDDGARLENAGLLEQAQAAFRTVSHARDDDPCVDDASAEALPQPCGGVKRQQEPQDRDSLTRIDEKQERRATYFELARRNRRAANLRARKGLKKGRRQAVVTAYCAYIEGLRIDPFATGARRGLLYLIARYRMPIAGSTDCKEAQRLLNANLLPEARLLYARALRAQQTSGCTEGMEDLDTSRAAAFSQLRVAKAAEQAGDNAAAWDAYVAALEQDPSRGPALQGLARVGLPQHRGAVDRLWHQLGVAAEDIGRALPIAVLMLGAAAVATLLLAWGLVGVASIVPSTRGAIRRVPYLGDTARQLVRVRAPPQLTLDEARVDRSFQIALGDDDVVTEFEVPPVAENGQPLAHVPVTTDTQHAFSMVDARVGAGFLAWRSMLPDPEDPILLEYTYETGGEGLELHWQLKDADRQWVLKSDVVRSSDLPPGAPADKQREDLGVMAAEQVRQARQAIAEALAT